MQFSSDDLIIDIRSARADEMEKREREREKRRGEGEEQNSLIVVDVTDNLKFSQGLLLLLASGELRPHLLIVCPPITSCVNYDEG